MKTALQGALFVTLLYLFVRFAVGFVYGFFTKEE